jgi:hypothetical protein
MTSTEQTRETWIAEAAAYILQRINDGEPNTPAFAREVAETLADNQEGDVSEWDDPETAAADELSCWTD